MITYTYGADADAAQSVTVTGTLNGADLNTVKRSFTLPDQNLPAPVITAPVAGSTVYGDQVTFTGTGTPGTNVIVVAVPTAALQAAANARAAQTPPADPADPIVVGTDGTWTVTLSAQPDDYTVTAVLADIGADGTIVSLLSPPSAPVEFILAATPVAPVVVTTPTPTPTPTAVAAASKSELADTGLGVTGAAAVAAFFGLAGAGLVLTRRTKAGNRTPTR
ncbi:hypothetical protein [Subtercola sp. YIM 133946]|uniref:hypothetical protein n=1 Tax=Subtercola sp. YIM 133946 TaxID=3118909 RepID=UPI002F923109